LDIITDSQNRCFISWVVYQLVKIIIVYTRLCEEIVVLNTKSVFIREQAIDKALVQESLLI